MKTKTLYGALFTVLLSLSSLTACGGTSGEDKYDKNGNLILELGNVYFSGDGEKTVSWEGSDTYTEMINEKFGVKIKPNGYSYGSWDAEVSRLVSGNTLTDVIHFNLKSYNFGTTYEQWIRKEAIKALPTNLSKWPNLEKMLKNISNIDALKVNGKLYGIPIANDISNPDKDFSNFTYVYRRDWVKEIDEAKKKVDPTYEPLLRENDVYTWDEFQRLLAAFKVYVEESKVTEDVVMVDQPWGFPSVTNFYKDSPHCFTKDESGKAINNFTSPKYVEGLKAAKSFVEKRYYPQDHYLFTVENDKAYAKYKSGLAGVLYDNFSLSNYVKLRSSIRKLSGVNVDDATALLKVKGPDGKFALEGTENWFSMTMFNYDISETKQNKILDIIDYLLSEEGTMLAVYGKKGYDYDIVDGKVVLSETGWERGIDGKYGEKNNGATFLRKMATLGNDTKAIDPYTDMEEYNIIKAWQDEMAAAKAAGNLRVFKEPSDISWMSTPTKNDKTQSLLEDANNYALQFCYNKPIDSLDAYYKAFSKEPDWNKSLDEINEKLGKK